MKVRMGVDRRSTAERRRKARVHVVHPEELHIGVLCWATRGVRVVGCRLRTRIKETQWVPLGIDGGEGKKDSKQHGHQARFPGPARRS